MSEKLKWGMLAYHHSYRKEKKMAKCVEKNNGTVERLSDDKAAELVRDGKAKYVAKHVWKAEK